MNRIQFPDDEDLIDIRLDHVFKAVFTRDTPAAYCQDRAGKTKDDGILQRLEELFTREQFNILAYTHKIVLRRHIVPIGHTYIRSVKSRPNPENGEGYQYRQQKGRPHSLSFMILICLCPMDIGAPYYNLSKV